MIFAYEIVTQARDLHAVWTQKKQAKAPLASNPASSAFCVSELT
jgi:hypothetical protein